MKRLSLLFVFGVAAFSVSPAHGQNGLFVIEATAENARENATGEPKLSPELDALARYADNNAVLRGVTSAGLPVILQGRAAAAEAETRAVTAADIDSPITKLLISYRSEAERTQIVKGLKANGLKLVTDGDRNDETPGIHEPGAFLVVEPVDSIKPATARWLRDNEAVSGAESVYRISIPDRVEVAHLIDRQMMAEAATNQSPDDPFFSRLWGLRNINAPTAWNRSPRAETVTVAVIDSGVDLSHPDLVKNLWVSNSGFHGYDFVEFDNVPDDENGHGTHVAGTIAGVGNNGTGVVGVTWETRIMVLRFLDKDGYGDTANAIRCIDYAIANKANILNNSWGGGGYSRELNRAIERARQAGILFVAAAGNEGADIDRDPGYPAAYDGENIISVAAIDIANERAIFSNVGRFSVDIAAPGKDILSTYKGDNYASISGTSMAAPHVSGAAALIWGQMKDPNWQKVRDCIYEHARQVDSLRSLLGHKAIVQGGALDLSSIEQCLGNSSGPDLPVKDDPPGKTPPPTAGVQPAFEQFTSGKYSAIRDGRNLASVTITLTEDADVLVQADTAALGISGTARIQTGFFDEEKSGKMWSVSTRTVTVKIDEWSRLGSSAIVRLSAGTHTIYWKAQINDASVRLDAGGLVVTQLGGASGGDTKAPGGNPCDKVDDFGNPVTDPNCK